MVEDVVTPDRARTGSGSMARSGTWTRAAPGGRVGVAWQRPDGRVVVRAPDEESLATARFMLAARRRHERVPRALRARPAARAVRARARRVPADAPRDGDARRRPRALRSAHRGAAGARDRAGDRARVRRPTSITQHALARLSPVELRRLGLAQHRATAPRAARRDARPRAAPRPADGDVVDARLARERCIGPWSVGVIALEGLGRYDHGLVGDLSLVKLHASLTGRWVEGRETAALLAPYGEWQGLAGEILLRGWARGLVPGASVDLARIARRRAAPGCIDLRHGGRRTTHRGPRSGTDRRGADLRAPLVGVATSGRHRRRRARRAERVAELAERHGIDATLDNVEAAAGAALVVVAVKPQDIDALLGEIGPAITTEQTVLSVAAAMPTATIEQHLASGVPVVRAMPNTPSTVHEGVAGLCAGAHADDGTSRSRRRRSPTSASVVRVPERHMDAVTAVSGSGPAYFALLAEAMIEAGLLLGLSREISTQLVVQTMLGTAKQLRDEGLHPVELREMVTSPGGTTIAAIRELESAGVRAAFLNAIQAAMTRARELAAGAGLSLQRDADLSPTTPSRTSRSEAAER